MKDKYYSNGESSSEEPKPSNPSINPTDDCYVDHNPNEEFIKSFFKKMKMKKELSDLKVSGIQNKTNNNKKISVLK